MYSGAGVGQVPLSFVVLKEEKHVNMINIKILQQCIRKKYNIFLLKTVNKQKK